MPPMAGLLAQFLSDSTNDRTDAYGGPSDTARLLVEGDAGRCLAIGSARTDIRLSPVTAGQ